MEIARRFVFRGNASALGGQIYRPRTVIIDVQGASSLGVAGGRSRSQIEGQSFGDIVRFGAASTFAEGLFDDEKRARDVTDHKGRQDQLTTTTNVWAEVRDLSVGVNPALTIKRLRGTLVSRSPEGSGEPSIIPARETVIQDVAIGGYGLTVSLNLALFKKYDTRAKILSASDDARFVEEYGNHLFMTTAFEGQVRPSRPRLPCGEIIYATIVKDISWVGRPYPGAKIDQNSVIVPEFGTVFFGELLISGRERRLTMLRFDLGSPIGGYGDSVDVESNGGYYP